MNTIARRIAALVVALALAVTAAGCANTPTATPTAATRAWHYAAMSAATFTLSALLGYIATEAIVKRIRGRN